MVRDTTTTYDGVRTVPVLTASDGSWYAMQDLIIRSGDTAATVVQDDLGNTYQLASADPA